MQTTIAVKPETKQKLTELQDAIAEEAGITKVTADDAINWMMERIGNA